MTPRLRALLALGTVVTLGGVGFVVALSGPGTTLPELLDAGLLAGQPFVLVCPEKLTDRTRARIAETQPGALGPRQRYARVARPAVCFRPAGASGNCFRADGTVFSAAEGGTVVVPGLKASAEDDDSDNALQFAPRECTGAPCQDFDAGAGTWANFCAGPRRLAVVLPPCVIPDCWTLADGGWNDSSAPVACRGVGVLGLPDGGPRWRGCNAMPAQYAVGAACRRVECSVLAGDRPEEVLR